MVEAEGPGGHHFAFKVVPLDPSETPGFHNYRADQRVRGVKPHRNLIQYLGVWLRTADGRLLENAHSLAEIDLGRLHVVDLLIQMPLAEKSLADRLRECQAEGRPGIPVGELLGCVRDAADGLDHLHKPVHQLDGKLIRIIHRDVKPENLLLLADDWVVVADYGIAPESTGERTESVALTRSYAPAEQWAGKPVPASDQYALALSYYELATGRLPFGGSAAALEQAASPDGRFDFRLVPPAVREVLWRATHPKPDARFGSCRGFVQALRAAVETGAAAPSAPVPAPYPVPGARPPAARDGTAVTARSKTHPPLPPGALPAPFPRLSLDATSEIDLPDPRSAPAAKRKSRSRAGAVTRRATVRYYSRMAPDRAYPLLVVLSAEQVAEVVQRAVKQAVSGGFAVPEGAVEVEPVLPGCDCYPPRDELTVADGAPAEARFWVVPRVRGWSRRPGWWSAGPAGCWPRCRSTPGSAGRWPPPSAGSSGWSSRT
ncbi:MAG: protein kinase [Gemmataceae bacterium]|nr:protein kinase [Gemmataceae bacterium]